MSLAILFHLPCAQHVSDILQPAKRTPPNTSRNKSSNTQRTENKTTDVVIHQHSRKLLKMVILMSEICWAHNKWNKIASDIKLVFHSSTNIFPLYLLKGTVFWKEYWIQNVYFEFLYNFFSSEKVFILIRTGRDMFQNVYRSSREVHVIFMRF